MGVPWQPGGKYWAYCWSGFLGANQSESSLSCFLGANQNQCLISKFSRVNQSWRLLWGFPKSQSDLNFPLRMSKSQSELNLPLRISRVKINLPQCFCLLSIPNNCHMENFVCHRVNLYGQGLRKQTVAGQTSFPTKSGCRNV